MLAIESGRAPRVIPVFAVKKPCLSQFAPTHPRESLQSPKIAMALPMNSLLPTSAEERKISTVSFLTEPTQIEPLETLEPGQTGNPSVNLDPALKALQQRILKLQVSQVVLGLTLMVLSSVALIEDRLIFGLGFGIISGLIAVSSAILGMQQPSSNLRFVAIFNMVALLVLLPTFYFVFENLIHHSRLYARNNYPPFYPHYPPFNTPPNFNRSLHESPSEAELRQYHANLLSQYVSMRRPTATPKSEMVNNTLWMLCWLELAHLVPLGASLLYLLFLYRYLNYYTHF